MLIIPNCKRRLDIIILLRRVHVDLGYGCLVLGYATSIEESCLVHSLHTELTKVFIVELTMDSVEILTQLDQLRLLLQR